MTLSCEQARARFEGYTAEALAAEERRGLRKHLGMCVDCREAASACDPLFAFAAAPEAAICPEEADRILASVRAGIALKQSERRLKVPSGRRRVGALVSAAASLALTLLAPGAPVYRAPSGVPTAERKAARSGFVPAANPVPAAGVFGTGKTPADATIYDLSSGDGQPRVVWIVDRSIDI